MTEGYAFISYAREDSHYVDRLVSHIHSSGVSSWVDTTIDYGVRWPQEIRDRIHACAVLVVVMTPSAEASKWVEREMLEAEHYEKPILPLLLAGQRFFRVNELQFEDVTNRAMPSERWTERLRALTSGSIQLTRNDLGNRLPPAPAETALGAESGEGRGMRTLMDIEGMTDDIASNIRHEVGDISRFKTEAQFASYAGATPGYHPAFNGRLLNLIASVASKQCDSSGRGKEYFERKLRSRGSAEEAQRALARQIARAAYACLVSERQSD